MSLKQLREIAARRFDEFGRRKLRRLGTTVAWQRVDDRFEMELDPADSMDQAYYLSTYDPRLTTLIERWVQPGDECIDAGAQKGYVTMQLAVQAGSNGAVAAFEPDPRARAAMIRNCQKNQFDHVRVFPYALGQTAGTAKFKLSSQLGWSTLFPNQKAEKTIVSEVEVPIRSVDELLRSGELKLDLARLTFVKIDCEGAEPLVLEGMRDLLRQAAPLVWIEINPGALQRGGASFSTVERQFRDAGFSLFTPQFHRLRLGRGRLSFEPAAGLSRFDGLDCFDLIAIKGQRAQSRLAMVGAVKPEAKIGIANGQPAP